MAVASDASPLIVLAKIGQLDLLGAVYGHVLIGPAVFDETVTRGRDLNASGAQTIERASAGGLIRTVRPNAVTRRQIEDLERTYRLGRGESEAISIAKQRRCAVIIDDKEARLAASVLGLDYTGTLGVILEAQHNNAITRATAVRAITDASKHLWVAPSVIAAVMQRLLKEPR